MNAATTPAKEHWLMCGAITRPHITNAPPFYLVRSEDETRFMVVKELGKDYVPHGPEVLLASAMRRAEQVAGGHRDALTSPHTLLALATALLAVDWAFNRPAPDAPAMAEAAAGAPVYGVAPPPPDLTQQALAKCTDCGA